MRTAHTDAGHIDGYDPACDACNIAINLHRLQVIQRAAVREFMGWCHDKGWTLTAHDGFTSYIPAEILTSALNKSGESSLDIDKIMGLFCSEQDQDQL